MEWRDILQKIRLIREEYDRSYKCLNTDRPTREETIEKHIKNLLRRLEEIRVILNVNYNRLSVSYRTAAEAYFEDVKEKTLIILNRKGLDIELPATIHEALVEIKHLNSTDKDNMSQTVVEFLNTASKIIPDFDGAADNVRGFIDALELVGTIKGEHEQTAVSLVKTKLKGAARNLITDEATLAAIITKIKGSIKGESVQVLVAKLMNIQQRNKTANQYTKEIEELTKSLQSAYISDGLTSAQADKYSTEQAVNAMTKNCSIEKVRLIMEAGQFTNMNDAVSKFITSCTSATGQSDTVMFYKRQNNNQFRGNFRGNYYRNNGNRGRGNRGGFNHNNRQYSNNSQYNNYNRQNNRNNGNRSRPQNVRVMAEGDQNSENQNLPLRN